jgi:hypothetical protein
MFAEVQAPRFKSAAGRWTAARKEEVVVAVWRGEIAREAALVRYELSDEELTAWERAVRTRGREGLKVRAARPRRRSRH